MDATLFYEALTKKRADEAEQIVTQFVEDMRSGKVVGCFSMTLYTDGSVKVNKIGAFQAEPALLEDFIRYLRSRTKEAT